MGPAGRSGVDHDRGTVLPEPRPVDRRRGGAVRRSSGRLAARGPGRPGGGGTIPFVTHEGRPAGVRGGVMSITGVATIAEVGRAAGVSRATVSPVMNGRSTVEPEMAARVRKPSRQLSYCPSPAARR